MLNWRQNGAVVANSEKPNRLGRGLDALLSRREIPRKQEAGTPPVPASDAAASSDAPSNTGPRDGGALRPSAQSEPIQTIALFWKMVKADPKTFDKIKADTVKIQKIAQTSSAASGESEPESENPLIDKVLKRMKPGGVWTSIIEDDQSYRLLKLLSVNDKEYVCKILTIDKKPFDPWFRDYASAHVPVVFNDQLLRIKLSLKYPQLWWLPK